MGIFLPPFLEEIIVKVIVTADIVPTYGFFPTPVSEGKQLL